MTYIAHMTGRLTLKALYFAVLLAAVMLSACSGGQYGNFNRYDPNNVQPVWHVKNSPVPVPRPRLKPAPPVKNVVAVPYTVPRIQGGQTAQLKPGQIVIVRKGDTVYGIARRYGAEVRQVIDANRLRPPYALKPGDRLLVPGDRVHVVQKGETTYSISRRYGVDLTSLVRTNGIKPPYTLRVGQKLQVPLAMKAADSTGQSAKSPVPPPPPRTGNGFMWPARGAILSSFGPKGGGLHNDGLNIRLKRGDPVKAAESGVVAYAGSELKGFGNLLLVRHEGGWVTAYAHNDRLLVKRGDRVVRGQHIAAGGMTGNVKTPQLHFEIRKGSSAVDPQRYLR